MAPRVTEAEAAFAAKRAPRRLRWCARRFARRPRRPNPGYCWELTRRGASRPTSPAGLRMRAATLSADAAAAYLADAEAAAASRSAARSRCARSRRARPPTRAPPPPRALELVAARRMELGDLCGARSAWERLLDSGGGTPQTRADWWIRAAAVAAALRDALPTGATEAELNTTIPGTADRCRSPRRCARSSPRPRNPTPAARSSSAGASRSPERPPAERGRAGGAARGRGGRRDRGSDRGRAPRNRSQQRGDHLARAARLGRPVGAPPRERAGRAPARDDWVSREAPRAPSTDGRFVATTAAGILRVFERTDAGLKLRWTRGSGFPLADLDEPNPNKPADVRLYCDGALLLGGRLFVASVLVGSDTTTSLECFDPVAGRGISSGRSPRGASSSRRTSGDSRRASRWYSPSRSPTAAAA